MFELIRVTRTDLNIDISFHANRKDATDAMITDMFALTDYASIDEIIDEADAGFCGLSDDEA